jgi:hypothetical protein
VGNDGETLVADSSTATGLRYQAPVNVNPVLNSAFQVWQRGTTSADSASSPYTADRWQLSRSSSSGATVTRQVTGDTTNLPFIQYCARVQRNSGNTSGNLIYLTQSMESINSIPYVGKTVTLSYYVRAGANYSASSSSFKMELITGTGTDQNLVSGFTGQTTVASLTHAITSTWQRFSFTGSIGSTATQLALGTTFAPTGTAGANDWYEITGVQLEVGSVATPFKTYAGTIQGELSAAQRYYTRFTGGQAYTRYGNAIGASGTALNATINLPVTLRTNPSSIDFGNLAVQQYGGQPVYSVTACTLESATQGLNTFVATLTIASGGTAGSIYTVLNNNNTAGFIGVSAEL